MKYIVMVGLLYVMVTGGYSAPVTNEVSPAPTNFIPLIQFTDVPITTGIENLARQTDINYLPQFDLYNYASGKADSEPVVTCRWEKITAHDALLRICEEHDLMLVRHPGIDIVRIIRIGQPKYFIDASLLGITTNTPGQKVKGIVPLIQFSDVPLDTAFMNLIRQSGRPISLAPSLTDDDRVVNRSKNGVSEKWFDMMPQVSLRWENVTVEEGIIALCESYGLEIVKDGENGNLQIVPQKIKRHHRRGH